MRTEAQTRGPRPLSPLLLPPRLPGANSSHPFLIPWCPGPYMGSPPCSRPATAVPWWGPWLRTERIRVGHVHPVGAQGKAWQKLSSPRSPAGNSQRKSLTHPRSRCCHVLARTAVPLGAHPRGLRRQVYGRGASLAPLRRLAAGRKPAAGGVLMWRPGTCEVGTPPAAVPGGA